MTSTPSDPTPEGAVPPPAPEGAVPPPGYTPPPPGYGQAPYAAAQPPLSDSDQRMWAMLAHLGGILFSFVAPLVIWLVFKERGRFVEEQSKEALNFQITLIIGYVISSILIIVLIGAFLMFIVWLAAIIFGILAAVAANKGEAYRYPFAIRLIK